MYIFEESYEPYSLKFSGTLGGILNKIIQKIGRKIGKNFPDNPKFVKGNLTTPESYGVFP